MDSFWFSLLNILLIQGFESHTIYRQKRVVQGDDAKLGEFPYQVSIQAFESNYHHCGGIILNEYFVITAAHCLEGFSPEDFQIVSGVTNLQKPKSIRYPVDFNIYEGYDLKRQWENDIALIKVDKPFIFDETISPAQLPDFNEEVTLDKKAIMSGFGRTAVQSAYTSRILKKAHVTIQELNLCKQKYHSTEYEFTDIHICVFDSPPTGMCAGDSGGPLTDEKDHKVIGLASFADRGCVNENFPSVYTKVSKFIP